jgi:hypothetical protein
MPTITIIDNPYVTLWYHPDTKIVHHQLHKFVSGKEFREFLLAGMDVLAKNKAKKWLSDDRSNSVLRKEDLEWGDQHWFPQTAQAGWKYWAIVQPEKVLAQVGMERLAKQYAKFGVTSKFFSDAREALSWLERQP